MRTPTGGTSPNDISDPIDQDIRIQRAMSWKKSIIRLAVVECSVTERRRWYPPYQTGKKLYMCTQTTTQLKQTNNTKKKQLDPDNTKRIRFIIDIREI